MTSNEYRTKMIKDVVVHAERTVISQRTFVGTLRSQLAEAERKLGEDERQLAEARGVAADLGISLATLEYGPGTLAEVFTPHLVDEGSWS